MAQSEAPPQKPEQTTGGVGIALGKELVITTIVPDSAAARNKAVRVGERVIAVAEIDQPAVRLQGKSVPEAVSLIRGAKGTTVRLTLVPAGKDEAQARDVILMRGELNLSGKGVPLADVLGWGDGELLPAGSEAPNIQMTVASGKRTQRLADFRGKVVVLEFWATWCAPCQKSMDDLQDLADKNPAWKDKVVLIAASVDEDRDALIKHLKAKGWTRTHNVHVGPDAIRAYHVGGIPTAYVIDRLGRIVAAGDIPVAKIVSGLLQAGASAESVPPR